MVDEFYMTLPSDSSMRLFPENSPSNYQTQLTPPLKLEGDWTVGLSEIHLPRKWRNINEVCNKFIVNFPDEFQMPVAQYVPKNPVGGASFKTEVEFDDPSPEYENIDSNFAIRIRLEFDVNEMYTREQYFETLQSALKAQKKTVIQSVMFDDGVSVTYKKFKSGLHVMYMYELAFKNNWVMLYDANELEPQHTAIARMYGCIPCSFFFPKFTPIRVNKHDDMYGEMPEHLAKLKTHHIYLYNTSNFKREDHLARRKRWMRSMVSVKHQCEIPPGSYTSPQALVAAMMDAIPARAHDYVRLSLTPAGYLKISSFNCTFFNFIFPAQDKEDFLGLVLGLSMMQLGKVLPKEPDVIEIDSLLAPHVVAKKKKKV